MSEGMDMEEFVEKLLANEDVAELFEKWAGLKDFPVVIHLNEAVTTVGMMLANFHSMEDAEIAEYGPSVTARFDQFLAHTSPTSLFVDGTEAAFWEQFVSIVKDLRIELEASPKVGDDHKIAFDVTNSTLTFEVIMCEIMATSIYKTIRIVEEES